MAYPFRNASHVRMHVQVALVCISSLLVVILLLLSSSLFLFHEPKHVLLRVRRHFRLLSPLRLCCWCSCLLSLQEVGVSSFFSFVRPFLLPHQSLDKHRPSQRTTAADSQSFFWRTAFTKLEIQLPGPSFSHVPRWPLPLPLSFGGRVRRHGIPDSSCNTTSSGPWRLRMY